MPALKNAKHEAVAVAFVQDPQRDGTKAYRSVYKGISAAAARVAFSRLLRKANFSARVGELVDAIASKAVMSRTEVLEELSKLGRSSIKKCLVSGDSTADVVESINDLPDEEAATIQELTVETYVEGHGDDAQEVKRVKLKLHNKHGALAELRRHYEPVKHEHTGKGGGAIETRDVTDIEIARRIAFLLSQAAKPQAA